MLNEGSHETRQEKRERKLKKKKERVRQHGKGLANIYKQAIEKRAGRARGTPAKGVDK